MECCNKSINDFRSAILEYLNAEKEYYEEDIRNNKALSDTEKIAAGLLIPQIRNCFNKSLVGLKIVIMVSWGFI
jgi:hypothetical protein